MSDNNSTQNTSTPSRPPNRHRQTRSSPQVPTTGTGKKNGHFNNNNNNNNNKNRRFNNANHGQQFQHQQPLKQESALTKKFREAAQIDNGAASDSAINSVVEKGIVTPPATPGPSNNRREPNAYVSDSAIGAHANGNGKKNFNNKKKGKGKRGTDIPNNAGVQHFTPPKQQYTPPDDILFGKPTPGRYAGACFHASPAPAALPLPKFFSKSVPTTTEGPSLSKMLAEADGSPQVIADSPPPTAPLRTPLDIFFQADKEEKARKALAAISQNEVVSPQPLATPASESHMVRNITPPSAALQNGLGSPFGGKSVKRDDIENDRDMLFAMDFSEKKAAPRPVEEVVIGPRHRPLSAKACDPETHIKRTEKANQIKAALMRGSQPFDLRGPPSPTPNPKFNAIEIPDTAGGVPLSPTIHERRTRTNNVGFAPAPRIRHFNQNRPVNSKANGQYQHHRNGRNQQQNYNHNVQNNFQQPNGQSAQTFDPVRARMAESHIRGVLKLDSPIPAI
ncbi:hypothetical protein TWF506_009867 [Arthrobotrys conoides]|uniref:Uncharacterized protein n=1 Tax=Arthrobotrys conoides TaxID=74498 RepID=A0AAN8NAC1_9PEZI